MREPHNILVVLLNTTLRDAPKNGGRKSVTKT